MAVATAITARGGFRRQFQSLFSRVWAVKCVLDAGSLADAAGESDTVTFTVATGGKDIALGDIVLGFSCSVDLAGMTVTSYVSAANVLTVRVQNEAAGVVDLVSATWRFVIVRPDTAAFF